jgi:two-component system phosphate regulon sensor histidine kinase PhoR
MTALKKIETMKKDLVTNVSHELRTPLTLIKGYVETLIDNETNEDKTKYLGIVLKNTERLDNIIKDLLTLSELESGKTNESFERVDLKTVIECVLPLFNEKLGEKGLDIQYDSPREQCVIAGDSFRLEQVVINLLDNAYKYTNAGKIAIAIERQDNSILLSVRDTGIGIPEKDLDRIFERFYVVNKSRSRTYGGTGLGLSIVKHIVVMHSGTIEVKSSPGLGSTFVLTFPAYKEQLT